MGRIRTVKPELFKHEDLYDLEKESGLPIRVAFIGMFTCCDREGRFKWRPRTLKLDVLPHDEIDFSRVLDALWSRGFVLKYAINGDEYGLIPTFNKHQVINNKESASEIPHPEENSFISIGCTREPRVIDAIGTPLFPDQGERKGKEWNGNGREMEGNEIHVEQNPLDVSAQFFDDDDRGDPVRTIFEYWQKIMKSPRSVLDNKRRTLIKTALKNYTPADICHAIRGCSKSAYHMGDNPSKTIYDGLNLILRSSEYIEKFIKIDENKNAHGNETDAERQARIIAEFCDEDKDDERTIEMETADGQD